MTGLWRRCPLWLKLMSAVVLLAALGLGLTGLFGVRLLRGYLVDRVDEQLDAAVRTLASSDVAGLDAQPAPLPSQFHVSIVGEDGDTVWSAPSTMSSGRPDLPTLTPTAAAAREGRPFTVDGADGESRWRAVALPAVDGSGSVVIATDLDDVDATVARLTRIDVLVGLAVLAGLAVAGVSVVRTSLRPLGEIEATAAAIGRGDLSRRVPEHPPGTELGRLGAALNAMLEQIERAFGARAASEARARRSEERMRRFVADASHELRTPLTSIRGFAELHRQGAVTDPDAVADVLGRIEGEATRMGLLVDDLLLLARLDQQRPLQVAPVDVGALVRSAGASAGAAAPERTIEVEVDDEPLTVDGDEARLHQVVGNLVDNALAYSPADAPVTLRAGRRDGDGHDVVCLEVVDRGVGLSDEQAARVFERFYRTDTARTRARGGTGLGLSIVAAITRAHDGEVEVDSAPGEGATFRVLLPARPPG